MSQGGTPQLAGPNARVPRHVATPRAAETSHLARNARNMAVCGMT